MGFHENYPRHSFQKFDKRHINFDNFILIGDAYSKLPRYYGTESINIEEVMDKLDMFQSIFGKLNEFGWWDLDKIKTSAGPQFISKNFQEGISIRKVRLTLEAPGHKYINEKFEVTWNNLKTVSH